MPLPRYSSRPTGLGIWYIEPDSNGCWQIRLEAHGNTQMVIHDTFSSPQAAALAVSRVELGIAAGGRTAEDFELHNWVIEYTEPEEPTPAPALVSAVMRMVAALKRP